MKLISAKELTPIDKNWIGDQLAGYEELDGGNHIQLKLYTDDGGNDLNHDITFCDSYGFLGFESQQSLGETEFTYWDFYDKPSDELSQRTLLIGTVETHDTLGIALPGSGTAEYFIPSGKWAIRGRLDGKLGYNLVLTEKWEPNFGHMATPEQLPVESDTQPIQVSHEDVEAELGESKRANITVRQDKMLATFSTQIKADRKPLKTLLHYPKSYDDKCSGDDMLGFLNPGRKLSLMHDGRKVADMSTECMWDLSICPRPYPEFVLEAF